MITIVNYGMGNLGSMLNMFRRIGFKAAIESDPSLIRRAKKLVLPGVGSFDTAMGCINNAPGLRDALEHNVLVERAPILGVCLGMQLLTRSSEEGRLAGLGWIPAVTSRFPKQDGLKVPHMGWNVAQPTTSNLLTAEVGDAPHYYFVHSYCVHVDNPAHSLMKTHYGIEFDSAIGNLNIYGVQFHPEKSHRFGMHLLENFANLQC
jgi:glutamine amidotransferase